MRDVIHHLPCPEHMVEQLAGRILPKWSTATSTCGRTVTWRIGGVAERPSTAGTAARRQEVR